MCKLFNFESRKLCVDFWVCSILAVWQTQNLNLWEIDCQDISKIIPQSKRFASILGIGLIWVSANKKYNLVGEVKKTLRFFEMFKVKKKLGNLSKKPLKDAFLSIFLYDILWRQFCYLALGFENPYKHV